MKFFPQESETMRSAEGTSGTRARPRLLYTFASNLIAVAHKAYQRVEQLDGAVGSLARGADVVAGPFVRRMEQQWLSSLSFMDWIILIAEKVLTTVFPPLRPVVFKVDELALLAGSLPDKFDRVVDDDIPKLMDWLRVAQPGAMLKNMVNSVMNSSLGRGINMADMDPGVEDAVVKGDQQHDRPNSSREAEETRVEEQQEYERLCKLREDDIKQVEKSCQEIMEALEEMGMGGKKGTDHGGHGENGTRTTGEVDKGDDARGGGGGGEIKEIEIKGSGGDHGVGGGARKRGGGGGGSNNVMMRDPIIELFDEGWQLKPLKG